MVEIRYSVKLRAVFTAGNPGLETHTNTWMVAAE